MNLQAISEQANLAFTSCEPLLKGWSRDKKYRLFTADAKAYLLRISDADSFDKKQKQFSLLKKISALGVYASAPVAFGTIPDGRVFTLLTWLEGKDAETYLPSLSPEEAFLLGEDAGRTMKKLHTVSIETPDCSWWERYETKIARKMQNFSDCPIPLPKKELVMQYVRDNMTKVKNRPTLFQHGDYHCGNMIVTNGKIGVIDFDKNGTADPYDEFKCFCWNVYANRHFERGLIHGYFDGAIPDDFFEILALYAAESMLGHITWAMRFGDREIETAKKVYRDMLIWFDDFHQTVPSWFSE